MRLYESQLTFKANKTWISRKTLGFIPGTMSSKVSIPAYNYHINSILLSIQSVDICWVILSKTLPDLGDGSCLMWGWQSELSWYHMLWWNQFSISFYDLQASHTTTTVCWTQLQTLKGTLQTTYQDQIWCRYGFLVSSSHMIEFSR